MHFSADTPAVDVLTQDGSATVVDNVAYPNATGYLTQDAGSDDLKVCADADNTVCRLDPGALDLAAGVDGVAAPATDTQAPVQPDGSMSGWPLAALALVGIAAFIGSLRWATVRIRR